MSYLSLINSTSIPLAGNATFTGITENVINYDSASVSVFSDVSCIAKGFHIEFSIDGTNWDFSYGYDLEGGKGRQITLTCQAQYMRVRITNDSVAQTQFRLQTILSNGKKSTTSDRDEMTDLIEFDSTLIVGRNVESINNQINTVYTDSNGNIQANIAEPRTAFGDLAVAQVQPIDGITFQYNLNTAIMTTTLTGSGTATKIGNLAVISTGTTTGSTASLRNNKECNYLPGIGMNIKFTALWSSPAVGTSSRIGYGLTTDGVYFGYSGTNFGIFLTNNNVDTFVQQSSWNQDKMDGTGPSRVTLDKTKGNVFQIRFKWHGFGCICYNMENPVTGRFIPVHRINYVNTSTTTSVNDPNGFLRMAVDNGATTSNISLSSAGLSMAYDSPPSVTIGVRFAYSADSVNITSSSLQSILSIRNKSTFQSRNNSVPVGLRFISIASNGNRPVRFELRSNATVTGASWADISINQSVMEYSTTIAEISTGQLIQSFYLGSSGSANIDLNSANIDIIPGSSLTVCCFTTNATNENSVSISWIERF